MSVDVPLEKKASRIIGRPFALAWEIFDRLHITSSILGSYLFLMHSFLYQKMFTNIFPPFGDMRYNSAKTKICLAILI